MRHYRPNKLFLLISAAVLAMTGSSTVSSKSTELTLKADRLGNAVIGMTLRSLQRAIGVLNVDKSQDPSGYCVIATQKRNGSIHFMIIDGTLTRIDIENSGSLRIRTEKGVHIGDSVESLKMKYGNNFEIVEGQSYPESYLMILKNENNGKNNLGFYIESGKIAWLLSGWHDSLLLEEGCLG